MARRQEISRELKELKGAASDTTLNKLHKAIDEGLPDRRPVSRVPQYHEGSDSDRGADSESDSDSDTDPDPESEPESNSNSNLNSGSDADSKDTSTDSGAKADTPIGSDAKAEVEASDSDMSQRARASRDRPRNTGGEQAEEAQLWNRIHANVNRLVELDAQFKDNTKKILAMEEKFKAREQNEGIKPSPDELTACDNLYRANLRTNEDMEAILKTDDLIGSTQILKGLVSHSEQEAAASRNSNPRDSHSRSAMDLDGSTDSPGPSPAENKHVRKLGVGRPSSQPPRDKEKDTSEHSELSNNPGRTKITFAMEADVAFKPKIPNQTEEHDWIQGVVVKVIGEGKSRRYDVQDPFPDDPSRPGTIYRSSASSMVPIPPAGTSLGPYEAGKQVLALYPETTTFYRAEVKAMLDNGSKVQLLFEDELNGVLMVVNRRFVLDHKG